ncbi:MAG: competence/damage-inducible protein A [Alphaproteobacteria bacterium]|nr:competence/damage-inducible protein A [Alphaproteobacteria bacterium]
MSAQSPQPAKPVTACLVIIGNEILSGRTQDANLAYMAKKLNTVGVQLREARVIPDVVATIVATVNEVRTAFDYVFTTGGIGPTHDDITSACIAQAFGVKLVRHPDAQRILEDYYKPADRTPARMKMADVPEGATLVQNPVSRAPGFRIANVFVFAGVPRIMQAMLDNVAPTLKGGLPVISRAIASQVREGALAAGLEAIQNEFPDVDIGSYPSFEAGSYGTSIVLRATAKPRLDAATEKVIALKRGLGGLPVEQPVV